jgi:hypothetical protein
LQTANDPNNAAQLLTSPFQFNIDLFDHQDAGSAISSVSHPLPRALQLMQKSISGKPKNTDKRKKSKSDDLVRSQIQKA